MRATVLPGGGTSGYTSGHTSALLPPYFHFRPLPLAPPLGSPRGHRSPCVESWVRGGTPPVRRAWSVTSRESGCHAGVRFAQGGKGRGQEVRENSHPPPQAPPSPGPALTVGIPVAAVAAEAAVSCWGD